MKKAWLFIDLNAQYKNKAFLKMYQLLYQKCDFLNTLWDRLVWLWQFNVLQIVELFCSLLCLKCNATHSELSKHAKTFLGGVCCTVLQVMTLWQCVAESICWHRMHGHKWLGRGWKKFPNKEQQSPSRQHTGKGKPGERSRDASCKAKWLDHHCGWLGTHARVL